jgi:hypothetical protein
MALFDNNPISALTNPVTSGIGSLFEGMTPFGSTIPSGILTEDQEAKLRNQALVQGLLGTAATYLATPKNLNAGSPLPYIGKAVLGGMGASQDVIDRAIRAKLLAGKDDNIRTYEKDRQKITEQYNPMTKKWEVLGTSSIDAPQQTKEEKPLDIERLISIRDRLKLENPNNPNIAIYEDLIQNARKGKEGLNINLGSPVAGVDPETGQPVFFQPSRTGGAPTIVPGVVPKAGEAQTKQIGGIDSLQSAISSYKDALKDWSPTDAADPIKRANMKTTYNNMMLQAKEAYGLGVLNGPDYAILTDTIADPTTAKGIAYGAFGALEGQADQLSALMARTKSSLQGAKGISKKETKPAAGQKIIKFDSQGKRVN